MAAVQDTVTLRAEDPKAFDAAVERACKALSEAEPEITRYDNVAGDGDCGLTLKAGAAGTCSVCLDLPARREVKLPGSLP